MWWRGAIIGVIVGLWIATGVAWGATAGLRFGFFLALACAVAAGSIAGSGVTAADLPARYAPAADRLRASLRSARAAPYRLNAELP
jgi:hypothetical protein